MRCICILTASNYPHGSASAHFLRLIAVGLKELGCEVEIFLQRGHYTDEANEEIYKVGNADGVKYFHCGFRLRPQNVVLRLFDTFLGNLNAIKKLFLLVCKRKLDAIVLYNRSGLESLSVVLFCRMTGVTLVSYVSEWQEKESITGGKLWRLPVWWDFLFRMKTVNSLCHAIMVPSSFLHDYYVKNQKFPENKVYVLPNLVDMEMFRQSESEAFLEKKGTRIGYCGIPTRKDGGRDLIKAFAIVCEYYPESELLLIGGKVRDANLFDNLKELAKHLNIYDKVIFTGRVPFRSVPSLLKSCDILALSRPSGTFAEAGFPTKLGEYMAFCKPVVVTKVGDMPHYLTHRKDAMLAEPDQPEHFAKQIVWLIEHPSDAEKIGRNGYHWAKDNLAYKESVSKMKKFLFNL